jgi:hypothetical protein
VGPDRRAHLRRTARLPGRGVLRRGEGGAGELHDVGVGGAGAVRGDGQYRLSAGHRHRLGQRRGARRRRGKHRTHPRGHP